jgi:predicted O-methyltransferase YrrM
MGLYFFAEIACREATCSMLRALGRLVGRLGLNWSMLIMQNMIRPAWKSSDTRLTVLALVPLVLTGVALATGVLQDQAAWWTTSLVGVTTVVVVMIACTRLLLKAHEDQSTATQASVELVHVLDLRLPLPPMTGWAITPQLAAICVRELWSRQPKVVVELGSGVSSIVHAYALAKLGQGKVWSLDHERDFAEKTRQSLVAHGVAHYVEVIDAPLIPHQIGGEIYLWYNLTGLPHDLNIDMLVIDGPPNHSGRLARYPALPLLRDRLADGALIVLDDAARTSERRAVERWLAECGDALQPTFLPTPKGTALLTYRRH